MKLTPENAAEFQHWIGQTATIGLKDYLRRKLDSHQKAAEASAITADRDSATINLLRSRAVREILDAITTGEFLA